MMYFTEFNLNACYFIFAKTIEVHFLGEKGCSVVTYINIIYIFTLAKGYSSEYQIVIQHALGIHFSCSVGLV